MVLTCCAALLVLLSVSGTWAETKCQTQDLSSNGYQYNQMTIPGAAVITGISVIKQKSRTPCILSVTFGSIGPNMFVDKGCRANFNVCFDTEPGNTVIVGCDSNDYKESTCNAGGVVKTLTLARQISKAACVPGSTFYAYNQFIVVNGGCRAIFNVGL